MADVRPLGKLPAVAREGHRNGNRAVVVKADGAVDERDNRAASASASNTGQP